MQDAVRMVAALAGYKTALVSTGLAISLLINTNGAEEPLPSPCRDCVKEALVHVSNASSKQKSKYGPKNVSIA